MDEMVYTTQQWLNKTYSDKHGYIELDLSNESIKGRTGWTTIYALTRAFQIELGIAEPASNFGPTTEARFKDRFPNGIHPAGEDETDNVYGIIQGALWCKGYSTGHYAETHGELDTHFDDSVENAIKQLKTDAGFLNPNGVVTLNVMKALLSMDYFVIGYGTGGDNGIRFIQQELNRSYENYIGLMPCDGIYGRNTNKAIIYALQAEEGLPLPGTGTIYDANGNFGNTTTRCCPTIPYDNVTTDFNGATYSKTKVFNITRLLQHSLYCNGFGSYGASGSYDIKTIEAIKEFQSFYALEVTGTADIGTWKSLLISCGDTSRPAKAFDCATILTTEKAQTLVNAGYEIGGRYLSGTIVGGASKALTPGEIQIIFDAGLRFFPIYQSSARTESYFNYTQGAEDATNAAVAAFALKIPSNTIIYFAVDFDAMDYQITNSVIPYFEGVYDTLSGIEVRKYRVGIYGARNICSRVCEAGYAVSSFVADMSTGFSGNLGFRIPKNWAFDQFTTITIGSGVGRIEIDKDGYSGRDPGVSNIQNPTISDAEYRAGVRLSTYNGRTYLDYTTPLNNLFQTAKSLAEEHRCISFEEYQAMVYPTPGPHYVAWLGTVITSFMWFYQKVNHNCEWDIKRKQRWEEALPNILYPGVSGRLFLFRGELRTAEEMGNIMYGYIGRATGFGEVLLYWGGGVANQGGMNNSEVNTPPNYGDSEEDHRMIELGYHLFEEEYPDYPAPGYSDIPADEGWLAAIGDFILGLM